MPTSTPNFGLLEPLIASSQDQDLWGQYLNTNIGHDDALILTAMVNKTVVEAASFSVVGRTNGTATTGNLRNLFLCNCTSGAMVASLPAADAVDNGFVVAFKKTDATGNALTVTPNGTDTIDLAATLVVNAQFDSFVLVSDGTANWNVMSYKHGTAPKIFSINIQIFDAPGSFNYTPTDGVVSADVEACGGGGSTAACSGNQGTPGAGAGAYACVSLTAAQIAAALSGGSIAGNIGGGGIGGGVGGETNLGSLVTLPGGSGSPSGFGQDAFGNGAPGGLPSIAVGVAVIKQEQGGQGGFGGQNAQSFGGAGGGCPLGQGGAAVAHIQSGGATDGLQGTGRGSGASGGASQAATANGAAGQPGTMTIKEYIYA